MLEPDRPTQQTDIDQLDKVPGRYGQAGEIPDPEQQLQKSHQPDLLWIIRQIRNGGVDNISISQDPLRSRIVYRQSIRCGNRASEEDQQDTKPKYKGQSKNEQSATEFLSYFFIQIQTSAKQ